MRTFPSLSSLRAFEVAARHQSFKKAATELHVTPTAVSHQIRGLEEAIGIQLFSRRARRVELTAAGERLFPVLRDSFEAIARAIDVVTQPGREEAMTLTATLAFTAKWLVPRLGSAPVALRVQASDDVVDLDAGDAELAIRYGRGPYRRLEATPLIIDRFAVVASPRLGVRTYADLVRLARIEFDWRNPDASTPTWARWARRARRVLSPARAKERAGSTLRFSDESHAIQAAIAGHGVALLSLTLVAEELRTRLLEIPLGPILDGPTYHLVHTRDRPLSPAARTVKDWLLAEARATRDELARLSVAQEPRKRRSGAAGRLRDDGR